MMTAAAPGGAPHGGSGSGSPIYLPAPPCFGEALRRGTLILKMF